MSNILEIKNLNYEDIFEKFNISIKKNKFITISGPNNCGKTTLIKILSGMNNIEADIYLNDKPKADYKVDEYLRMVRLIIPGEITVTEKNLEETLHLYTKEIIDKDFLQNLISTLKLKQILKKDYQTYTKKEKVLVQLATALVKRPKVLLIDDLDKYFTEKELSRIFDYLTSYNDSLGLTLICTTNNLNLALFTDYLYIIHEKKVYLEGTPLEVLEKDNVINKIGLSLPFMVDLSVKLRDYDLLKEIELDKKRMVDKLWN